MMNRTFTEECGYRSPPGPGSPFAQRRRPPCARCYFGMDRRRSSNVDGRTVAAEDADPTTLIEVIDLFGQLEVGVRETPGGMVGDGQPHLVPAVHEDVGVVVGRLGDLGDAIDERDRRDEVVELPIADDLLTLSLPAGSLQPRDSISSSLSSSAISFSL
jgi:hypothetical protein